MLSHSVQTLLANVPHSVCKINCCVGGNLQSRLKGVFQFIPLTGCHICVSDLLCIYIYIIYIDFT